MGWVHYLAGVAIIMRVAQPQAVSQFMESELIIRPSFIKLAARFITPSMKAKHVQRPLAAVAVVVGEVKVSTAHSSADRYAVKNHGVFHTAIDNP